MSRYIDADALMEHAEQCLKIYNDMYEAMESGYTDEERDAVDAQRCTATEFVDLIHNAPTVDAVPVVRCGKCKYFIENTWECVRLSDRFGDEYSDARVYPEYFCADGERRTDEQQT